MLNWLTFSCTAFHFRTACGALKYPTAGSVGDVAPPVSTSSPMSSSTTRRISSGPPALNSIVLTLQPS